MRTAFDIQRLRALVVKEIAQIMRDPAVFLIAFALPIVLLVIFGYGVSLDTNRMRIGVAVLDDGEAARSLAQTYRNSSWFDARMAHSVAPLKPMIVDGKIRGIVVIPDDFSKRSEQGQGTIQIITDGSLPNNANFVVSYAEGVRAAWAADRAAMREGTAFARSTPRIAVNSRLWFNPSLTSRYFLVPGAIAIVMAMIGTLLTALVVAREWERGTMEAMMATPMRMTEFIASKILPYFVLGLCSMALCSLLAVTMFGVPLRGSAGALVAVSSAFLLPALGQGLLISSATKNQFVASQLALITGFLPTFLLSGFLFEISSMPAPIQALTYAVPARYLIPSLQTVFAAGDIWALLLPNIAVMLAFGALFFLLSFRVNRRSLDT